MSDEGPLEQFDDERIVRGLVTDAERRALEDRLVEMYIRRAKERGVGLVIVRDAKEYVALKTSGEVFDGRNFYLYMNDHDCVGDMAPIVVRMIDTPEGLFLGKLRQQYA
ncbi:hypothetical protein HY642_06410 [Candidatus Woesearchaeota archaeon]|nr:hypothetical protein [Candidatus Woesearchaeota archaeon]